MSENPHNIEHQEILTEIKHYDLMVAPDEKSGNSNQCNRHFIQPRGAARSKVFGSLKS